MPRGGGGGKGGVEGERLAWFDKYTAGEVGLQVAAAEQSWHV